MAALVVAGSGRRVVKHGNRAASSACGTADVLEELGVVIDLPPDGRGAHRRRGRHRLLLRAGCSTPACGTPARRARELGVPTFFNFLGPLTNPARVTAAAVGCADRRMAPLMAAVLAARGDTALVFRGDDGLDELTTTTTSSVWVAAGEAVTEVSLDPTAFGIAAGAAAGAARRRRDAQRRRRARRARRRRARGHPRRGAAQRGRRDRRLRRAERGRADAALRAGLHEAADAVDSGAAASLLDRWIAASQAAAPMRWIDSRARSARPR